MLDWPTIDQLIKKALSEDFGELGDVTTDSTLPDNPMAEAKLVAKQSGIVCGLPVFQRVFTHLDEGVSCRFFLEDGQTLHSGDTIGSVQGSLKAILKGERTALNLLQRLSGIASLTAQFVSAVQNTRAVILDTRKTTPTFRMLEKYAVKKGGGANHRFGLYDMVMIKDNHIDGAGGITPAVESCLRYLDKNRIQIPIEVETRTLDEVKEALKLPIHRIMLDNMSLQQMKQAVAFIDGAKEVEASGNVSLETVADIASTGVDFISVGKLTHSANALDISLRIA